MMFAHWDSKITVKLVWKTSSSWITFSFYFSSIELKLHIVLEIIFNFKENVQNVAGQDFLKSLLQMDSKELTERWKTREPRAVKVPSLVEDDEDLWVSSIFLNNSFLFCCRDVGQSERLLTGNQQVDQGADARSKGHPWGSH